MSKFGAADRRAQGGTGCETPFLAVGANLPTWHWSCAIHQYSKFLGVSNDLGNGSHRDQIGQR
jgi:hypothetical protein